MRKHKSVVAILLAVMMIFTFMPTMAFADDTPYGPYPAASWGPKLAKVYDTKGKEFATDRVFDSAAGYVIATPVDDTSVVGDTKFAPKSAGYFYDFDGSAFVGSDKKPIDKKSYTQAYLDNHEIINIQLVEQNYTKPYVDGVKTKASEAATTEFHVNGKIVNTKEDKQIAAVKIGNYVYDVWQSPYEAGLKKIRQ